MKVFVLNKDLSQRDITLRVKIKNALMYVLLVSVIGLSSAFVLIKPSQKIVKVKEIDTVYLPSEAADIPLTDSAITAELVRQHCILPHVALAQMKLETGNFKSAICKENKNIAGIRTSNSKFVKRDAKGNAVKNRLHNVYNSYRDCLSDYVRIQDRYLKNIDGKYASAPNYIETLRKVK